MRFSLKKKLKRVGAAALAGVMAVGLMTSLPAGIFAPKEAKAADAVTTVTWDLAANTQKIEKTTGVILATDGKTELAVDASTGKAAGDGAKHTQLNNTTKLTVPVPANAKYTITANIYKGGTFTINGEALESPAEGGYNPVSYSGTTKDATGIDIVMTSNTYGSKVVLTWEDAGDYVEPVAPVVPGNGKVDAVDFGAEVLEGYNNLFTVDIATAAHPGSPAGTKGVCVTDFTVKDLDGNDFVYFCAGGKTNNRLRTINTALSRYDDNKKTDKDGKVYSGFLYSNSEKSQDVYLNITLTANDKLTMWLGSNGKSALYYLVAPSGRIIELEFGNTAGVEEVVAYAPETGTYKLWCTNEKLVVARILREHSTPVKVTGTTTYEDPKSLGVAAPEDYKLGFACKETGAVTEAALKSDGTYTAYLYDGFNYEVSLIDANGYIIATETALTVKGVEGAATYDCKINPVELVTVTGTITGIESVDLAKMSMIFAADKIYVPEFTFDADKKTYTLVLEKGVEYAVTAIDVNDYTLKTTKVSATADGTSTIDFEAKPVYDVTITLEGISDEVAANATYTFTNIAEKFTDKNATPYTYTFKATDKIQLRDGQYQVKVTGLNQLPLKQMYTKDVKVKGATGSTTVKFQTMTEWDFSTVWNTAEDVQIIGENGYVMGIKTSVSVSTDENGNKKYGKNVMANKTYLLMNNGGSFEVPVKKGDTVTFTYCYQAAFKVGETVVGSNSGSTTKFESTSIVATEDGVMLVEGVEVAGVLDKNGAESTAKQTYFTKISVSSAGAEYQEVVKVGANKQFTTINDALDFIAKMTRTEEQRVTVEIDPGTYDEMLVIDMPNVTLKNASSTPSIELKNSGVDADKNAVRITSYYGHGYTYYSMGPDCKYDAWLLEVNQYNGYPLFENPGTGTTSGSYWNATVVVYANGFNADGIIFENAFNQYVSELAAADTIVAQSGAKGEANGKRDDMKAGDTSVQNKAYVERAAALATANGVDKAYFNNCKFVGRQDTLYLGTGRSAFNECSIYGGTDYIFGPGTSVFNKCDLVFNTMETNTDVGYITAAQTAATDNGFLLEGCTIKSTFPGVDTASASVSKPGYFGRPWGANGEAVFSNTIIESTMDASGNVISLINAVGWLDSLAGQSPNSLEYNTTENAGVDNSANRASWAGVLTEAKSAKGVALDIHTWLGDWDPFDAVDDNNSTTDDEEKDSADAGITTPDAADKVELTDKEKEEVAAGAEVKLVVEATNIADSVSAEEKALVEALITGDLADFTIGTYLDIDLFKVIGDNKSAVTNTTSPLTVTVALPDSLVSKTNERTYYVVRIHNGVATAIKADYNKANQTISFATDKFSTYAVLYKDGAALPEEPINPGEGGNTGDATPVAGYAALAFGSVIVLAALILFDRKRRMVK